MSHEYPSLTFDFVVLEVILTGKKKKGVINGNKYGVKSDGKVDKVEEEGGTREVGRGGSRGRRSRIGRAQCMGRTKHLTHRM